MERGETLIEKFALISIRILPSARRDLGIGFRFYEKQEPGVGDYFLDSIAAEIDSLQLYAGIHRKRGDLHRFTAKRFPYWIYYFYEQPTVYVAAVLDARQDQQKIEQREKRENQRFS